MLLRLREVRSQLRGEYATSDDEDPFDSDMPTANSRQSKRPKEDVPTPPSSGTPRTVATEQGGSAVEALLPGLDVNRPTGRDSNSPIEGVATRDNEAFFRGDLGNMAGRILELAADESTEDRTECDRLRLWVMYSGAGEAPPSYLNRRVPTRWEEEGGRLAPTEETTVQDPKLDKKSKVYTRRDEGTGTGGSQNRRNVRPSRTLGVRANVMADRVKNDPMRLLGVLGNGGSNRKWVIQIARAIIEKGIGEGTLRNWAARAPVWAGSDRRRFAQQVKDAVELWANGEGVV